MRDFKIILSLLVCVFLISHFPSDAAQEKMYEITDLPQTYESFRLTHPKMDYLICQLLDKYRNNGLDNAKKFALQRNIDILEDKVRVIVELRQNVFSNEKTEIMLIKAKLQIEALGGEVENTLLQMIQTMIPISSLGYLPDLVNVNYIRIPLKLIPMYTSEGVDKINASALIAITGYRSSGVKIGVLDFGFQGYDTLLGTELPSSVIAQSFRADNNISNGEVHGTACAEIIHDIVPNAELYLANFGTIIEKGKAVDWLVDNDVQIISNSTGSYLGGAGDGTGPSSEIVKDAVNRGVVFVNAAGNAAEDHWYGNWVDSDSDNLNNFSGVDEILHFWVPANKSVSVELKWNNWGYWNGTSYTGSNQDYDLYLYYWDGYQWKYVTRSQNTQNGFQWPIEYIYGWSYVKATWWGVAIKKWNSNMNVRFDLFVSGNSNPIEYNKPQGSIGIPADSPYAIAVGATDCINDDYHSYSSRGPTLDGRIKPDYSAPSGVTTSSYGTRDFYGTSASCPHFAGAVGLLLDKTPFSISDVIKIIKTRVVDLGQTGMDNKYGEGRVDLKKK